MTFAPAETLQESDAENSNFLAHFVEKELRSEAWAKWTSMIWIVVGCVWILACSLIAMLPIRRQIVPGVMLLTAGPVVIWVLIEHVGWLVVGIGLFAFFSMFRNHMIYMMQRMMGQRPEIPK